MEGLKDSVMFDFVTPLSEKWCTRFDSGVQLQRSGKSSFVPLVLRARRIGGGDRDVVCNRGSRILERG